MKLGSDDKYLKRKDLKIGECYFVRDGRILMYLGFGKYTKKFMFYFINLTPTRTTYYSYELFRENIYHELNKQAFMLAINSPDLSHVSSYSGVPKITSVYPNLHLGFNVVKAWYQKLVALDNKRGCDIPIEFLEQGGEKAKKPSRYVSSKDLIPGHFYKTSENPWRSTYLYLGRLGSKYVYAFVCNDNFVELLHEDYLGALQKYWDEVNVYKSRKNVMEMDTLTHMDRGTAEAAMQKMINNGWLHEY